MDYETAVNHLASNFGVDSSVVEESLKEDFSLRSMPLEWSNFNLERRCGDDYLEKCNGVIPENMYQMRVNFGRQYRTAMVYNHKMVVLGQEQVKIETSRVTDANCHQWDPELFLPRVMPETLSKDYMP